MSKFSYLNDFLSDLAFPFPTPGGGSAAAFAGAMSAALGQKVILLSKWEDCNLGDDWVFLAEAVSKDATAYDNVVAAYKMSKTERKSFVEKALHDATIVPLEVAERVFNINFILRTRADKVPSKLKSDFETALALADAAFISALANVKINLQLCNDQSFCETVLERLKKIKIAP